MFKARLLTPLISPATRHTILQAEIIEGDFLDWYDSQDESKVYEIIIKVFRRLRSKDANSYFHVLCGKIADAIGSSKIEVKNRMIALYGQPVIIDGGLDFIIVRDDKDVGKFETLHLKTTPQTKELNGVLYRVYINMIPTHELDTKDMAMLIDGTISEAREIGLPEAEIISPNEAAMLESYGVRI